MEVDAGNPLSPVTVKEKENTGKGEEVDLEKAEVNVSRPRTPVTDGGDVPLEPVFSRAKDLPFSRARLIALVVTLTGAAFLNVSIFELLINNLEVLYPTYIANAKDRLWVFKPP